MFQLASVSSPVAPPLAPPLAAEAAEDDDVDIFLLRAGLLSDPGQLTPPHVLIVADHGLALLRGLIRRGCPAATCIRPAARPESGAYELVCFPDVTRETDLERLIRDALRATVPNGRLIARVSGDPDGRVASGLVRRLKLNGFANVRTLASTGRYFLQAELSAPADATGRRHVKGGTHTAEPQRRAS
jgi:hypothetical protein